MEVEGGVFNKSQRQEGLRFPVRREIGFVIFRELMYADLKDSSQSQDKSNMLKYMLLLLHYIKKLT